MLTEEKKRQSQRCQQKSEYFIKNVAVVDGLESLTVFSDFIENCKGCWIKERAHCSVFMHNAHHFNFHLRQTANSWTKSYMMC